MVENADLLENVHHVKLDPFFDDLSSFDEDDVYLSDGNSRTLTLTWSSIGHI